LTGDIDDDEDVLY